jgi:ADP-ribosylglycohydrolase
METIDAVPAMIKLLPEEERDYSQAKLGEAMARWQKDKKTVRDMARRNEVGERQIFDALEYALHGELKSKVGNDAISPIAPIAVTRHDTDREKLKKEFERGNPDILDRLFG